MDVINKPMLLIRAPVSTRSGYGEMSRDICRHIIGLNRYDVRIWAVNWGSTPMTGLNPNDPNDLSIIQHLLTEPNLPQQPDVFVSITIPIEFQPMGKYNIGITAGIETTACAPDWLEGCNRMNTVWCISEHAKRVFESTSYTKNDQSGKKIEDISLRVPCEVLHNCIDTKVMKKVTSMEIPKFVDDLLLDVKERFAFLFVGHWLAGGLGEDRKDVGMLVKTFMETFKDVPQVTRPALILKTSGAAFSVLDREDILNKIQNIKNTIGSPNLPNVYILHGDLTEEEMNGLYNHPKVKVHASFTKGEGFGRPLLEATQSEKPIIASGWSGQLDFLDPENAVLLDGSLTEAAASAQWNGQKIDGAAWFTVNYANASQILKYVWRNYDRFKDKARTLARKNKEKFSYEAIQKRTDELFTKYVPQFAVQAPFQLPTLKKLGEINAPAAQPALSTQTVS